MDIISMIKCMCKYKIKGIYNDLSMHLINIIKFYSQSIVVMFGTLAILVSFLQVIVAIEDVNIYFNYIFQVCVILAIVGYMYSPLTLIIFSNPDIFYLIRNKRLFNWIFLMELIRKNLEMLVCIIGCSYFINYNIQSTNIISVLSLLLLIPIIANVKYYIFNKVNYNKWKLVTILTFSIQVLHPNIYLIIIEYFISIVIVSLVFNNLNLEKLIPMYEYHYNASRIIKIGSNSISVDALENSQNKKEIAVENIHAYDGNSIFFKFNKNLAFLIKDYKSMKNRTNAMNIIFIVLIISIAILNVLFPEYRLLLYVLLYGIVNSQLKSIFNNNYYVFFNKLPLCSSIKSFINETSFFSMLIYTIVNTILFILQDSLYYTIPFIVLISVSSVLVSNYNSLKNLSISVFNLYNIVLASIYIMLESYTISIVLVGLYSFILYKVLYRSIKLRVNFTVEN